MGLLDGKVTIITGAGGGLGRSYALLFAREGAKVVVNDLGGTRDGSGGGQAMADQVVGEIREAGGEAIANHASVADEAGAQSIIDDAIEAYGRVDVLVNNAGILRDKTLHKLTAENYDLVMAVHARGTFLVTKAATQAMAQNSDGGSVINTSSISGLKGNFGQTNYACAKAGIAGMTRTWSQELQRYGVRTNAIAPMALTRMTEDIASVPEDFTADAVAPMALFLASDLSSDVNGRIFGVHGPHCFEYHMVLSPGVDLAEGSWTASDIAKRLGEIGDLPAPEAASDGGESAGGSIPERVAEVFGGMTQIFDPERAGDWSSVLCFDITGTGQWTVEVSGGACTVSDGRPDAAKCTIVYDSAETFLGTTSGEINPQQAFMAGKIKADNIADVMKFSQCFDMKKAAAMRAERAGGAEAKTPTQQVAAVFTGMAEVFDPDRAGDWSSVLCFDVTGTGTWTVRVGDGVCKVAEGRAEDAKCTIIYDSTETFLGTTSGKINSQQAFMAGKIKADNIADVMKFSQCFDMKKAAAMREERSGGGGGSSAPTNASRSGINKDALGKMWRTGAEFVYLDDTEAYAKAANDGNAAYAGGDDVMAPPLFAMRPLMESLGKAIMDPNLNANIPRLVHGEHDMRFHSVLRPWDLVAARSSVVSVEEKSSGELVAVQQRLMRDGEVVVEVTGGYFIRGDKKGPGSGSQAEETEEATRELVFESTSTVDADQPIRYAAASLDRNPIHVDDAAAKAAGLPGIILHGLCTMAMTARDVVDQVCDGDPRRLARLKVRFSKIVLPGDTLTVRGYHQGRDGDVRTLGLEVTNQKGEKVLTQGLAEIRNA